MSGDCRLVIFAKSPVPGRVKTRLARHLGARAACFWYRRLLETTVERAVASGLPAELWLTPHRDHPWLRGLARRWQLPLHVQPPGNLGRRMWHASRRRGRTPGRVLILGADCTSVAVSLLQEAAFTPLAAGDALVIPAEDGGYVLLAADDPPAQLLRSIPWGGKRVLQRSRVQMRRTGGCLRELESSWDVDELPDLKRLLRNGILRPWHRGSSGH